MRWEGVEFVGVFWQGGSEVVFLLAVKNIVQARSQGGGHTIEPEGR